MNKYRVTTSMDVYGQSIMCMAAHTPYDAAEKVKKFMAWRQRDAITTQHVIILDGSQNEWTFEKEPAQ